MDVIFTQHARTRMADPHRGVVTEEKVRAVLASPTVSYVGIDGKQNMLGEVNGEHIRICFVEDEGRLLIITVINRGRSMKLEYDAEADAAYIRFSEIPRSRTEEESDVCIVDFDPTGNVVGIELLSVFGFAGASLYALVRKGLLAQQDAERLLRELRHELVTA